jgi:Asp-tRNA(Asn)/Glu-tRNA(Gln) amidotransferase A subunit family amidase
MEYSRARFKQRAFRQAVSHLFREIDLLVFPTTPIVAPVISESGTLAVSQLLLRHTGPFNLAGLPVITVPCGFSSDGLPIGLSIAGRPWEEALVLRAGHAFQEATQWHRRRPAILER